MPRKHKSKLNSETEYLEHEVLMGSDWQELRIPRSQWSTSSDESSDEEEMEQEMPWDPPEADGPPSNAGSPPSETQYQQQQKENSDKWGAMVPFMVEGIAWYLHKQADSCCVTDCSRAATCACINCDNYFLCEEHGAAHGNQYLSHVLYRRGSVEPVICHTACNIMQLCRPDCQSVVHASHNLVTQYGIKQLHSTFCTCLGAGSRMMKYLQLGLWPTSPDRPETFFTLELMNMHLSLLYSNKTSLYAFFEYLYQSPRMIGVKQDFCFNKFWYEEMYRTSRECFNQFRFVHARTKSAHPLKPLTPFKCPICLLDSSAKTIRVATDACFSLKNLKRKRPDNRRPLFEDAYFLDRDTVDQALQPAGKMDTTCGHRAGDQMQLPSKKGLDVTATMTLVCEHETFISATCLSQGEKYGYAAALLQNLLDEIHNNVRVVFFYDVNCTFSKYWGNHHGISDHILFPIPVFHADGHVLRCKLQFHPRMMEGVGLWDGEVVERVWFEFLKARGAVKHMTTRNFIDFLSWFMHIRNIEIIFEDLPSIMRRKCVGLDKACSKAQQVLDKLSDQFPNESFETFTQSPQDPLTADAQASVEHISAKIAILNADIYKRNGYRGTLANIKVRDKLLSQLNDACEELSRCLGRKIKASDILDMEFDYGNGENHGTPTLLQRYEGYLARCILRRAEEETVYITNQVRSLCHEYAKMIVDLEEQSEVEQHWFSRLRCAQTAAELRNRLKECAQIAFQLGISLDSEKID